MPVLMRWLNSILRQVYSPNVILTRHTHLHGRVLGRLSVFMGPVRVFNCATLELPWINNQPRVSCIPEGRYTMKFEYSNSFKEFLWELKNVPGRSEIKIHRANYPKDLLGCIALGLSHADIDKDGLLDVISSRVAVERFHTAMDGFTESSILVAG